MPRFQQRRSLIARAALVAWLVFVVVASVAPFVLYARWWTASDRGWRASGGSVGWFLEDPRKRSDWFFYTDRHAGDTLILLRPSVRSWAEFAVDLPRPGGFPRWEYTVSAPPWAVLLLPTVMALIIHRVVRHRTRHKLTKFGRTPCPACGYDATGLSTCPECGTEMERPAQPAP